jgi:F-type H+-transporting ATPase subunit delta
MAELATIARPYAKAAFEFADQAQQTQAWSEVLIALGAIIENETMQSLMNHPQVTTPQLTELVKSLLQQFSLNENIENFIQLLIESRRLYCVPAIAERFLALMAEKEKRMDVIVTSAHPVGAGTQAKLQKSLEKRLKCKVQIEYQIDASIIGGMIIRAGDLLIDGSVHSQLADMYEQMVA